MNSNQMPLPFVQPNLNNWGMYQLSLHRDEFLAEVVESTFVKLKEKLNTNKKMYEALASALYLERIRLSTSRWKSDPKDDKDFWNNIKGSLIKIKKIPNWETETSKDIESVLRKILFRYAYEIVGNFNPTVFKSVQKFLPFVFSFVLNSTRNPNGRKWPTEKKGLYKKFNIHGNFEHIRALAKIGTIIVVPTHSSNVDSPIIGWAINAIGLEAVTYGAGVNLFGTQPLSFLMGNLGAYKIDRRKKNAIYLEILKQYSKIAIQRNTPSLFYPGGTRSRSGQLETKLKLGLLSTAIEAQQYNFQNNGKKIFVIPVVLNYHFNIEAASLINQFLKETGKELYVADNFEYSTTYKMIRLFKQLLKSDPEIFINFCDPMDILGHKVNSEGMSLSPQGIPFDIKGYFEIENNIIPDEQRNFEYTKILGDKIVDSYYKNNMVLTSNLVSFCLFELIQKLRPNLSLYEILLLPIEDRIVGKELFFNNLEKLRHKVLELENKGKIKSTENVKNMSTAEILDHAISNINLLSSKKIVYKDPDGNLNCEDLRLLYFYHNRLKGYYFEKVIST